LQTIPEHQNLDVLTHRRIILRRSDNFFKVISEEKMRFIPEKQRREKPFPAVV